MRVEAPNLGRGRTRRAAVLRDLAHGRAISLERALEAMAGRALLIAAPPSLTESESGDSQVEAFLIALRSASLPVLAGELSDDRAWLEDMVSEVPGAAIIAIEAALARVEATPGEAAGLCGVVQGLLRGLGHESLEVCVGQFFDSRGRPERSPVFGTEVVGAATKLAYHGGDWVPRASLERCKLWFNTHHVLVEAAISRFVTQPLLAGSTLALAVNGYLDEPHDPGDIAKLAAELDEEAGA